MKKINNPFELNTYLGPEFFCDREKEVAILQQSMDNRRNTVLSSMRRLGKTNLIAHWHHLLAKQKRTIPIYVDVLDTRSDNEFVQRFITAVLQALEEKESFVARVSRLFSRMRPQITFDPYSGSPVLTLDFRSVEERKEGLDILFSILKDRKENIQITFDEFQIIATYEEKSVIDASLRSYFSEAENIHFLFCGSQQHLLTSLFSDARKPLFASTQQMTLDYIPYPEYFDFIQCQFERFGKSIRDEAIHEVLMWTHSHTFYTHFLANELFGKYNVVDYEVVKKCEKSCLDLFRVSHQLLLNSLPSNQKNLLNAIAKEGRVKSITGKDFLNNYNFSASSTTQALSSLIDKEIILKDLVTNEYFVQDVFLSRFLEII